MSEIEFNQGLKKNEDNCGPTKDSVYMFYWLVGLFEGEAYFGWLEKSETAIVEVQMTDEAVIAKIASLFDAKYQIRKRLSDKHRPVFRVSLRGKRAMQLMHRMYPYLSPRRKAAIRKIEKAYVESTGKKDYSKDFLYFSTTKPHTIERKGLCDQSYDDS